MGEGHMGATALAIDLRRQATHNSCARLGDLEQRRCACFGGACQEFWNLLWDLVCLVHKGK